MGKQIKMRVGDRWGIIGASGSGKTFFTKQLLHSIAIETKGKLPIYILDTKIERNGGDFKEFYQKGMGELFKENEPPPIHEPSAGPFQVWQPEEDSLEMFDAWFEQLYRNRMPCIIYIDELSSITNAKASVFPRFYDVLLKQGRGLDIGVISTTQSPSFIPPNLLRQATHLIRFRLNDEFDAKKLSTQLGKETASREPDHTYGFYYRDCTKPKKTNKVQYFDQMQTFFGMK